MRREEKDELLSFFAPFSLRAAGNFSFVFGGLLILFVLEAVFSCGFFFLA